jgi:pimeloyl-ACP methyl ester carboxylesterase
VSTPTSLTLPAGVRRTTVACDRGTFAALEAIPESGACELGTALLVPGYTGSKEDFLSILGELAYGGRRVLAIDQRGQYETPGPDDPAAYDLAELGEDVAALLAATGAIHLLGHSFGGLVARAALLLPAGVPIASITLMSSGPGAIPGNRAAELRSFLDAVGAVTGPDQLRATVAAIWHKSRKPQAIAAGVDPSIVDFLQDRMLGTSPTSLVAMARDLLTAPDLTEDLAKLGVPVFVLYGENDDAWPAEIQEDMAALLGARRKCIPGAAHSPAVEAPATTAYALTDFWNLAELADVGEAVPGASGDGSEPSGLAVAQVVTPSAGGTRPGREDLILPA